MAFEFDINFEADDGLESDDNKWQWSGRNATIFLIDTAPYMLIKNSDDCSFDTTLKCIHATLSRNIIANDQDLYSVILFNTVQAKNSVDFPNIYVLQDLDRPGAERILEIEGLLEDGNKKKIKENYGCSVGANIHDILWVCRNVIINCKTRLSSRNVLLFTNQDNPHANDDHKRRQAFKGAKDLKEAGIDLEILPLNESFNINLFYKELLSQDDEESESLSILADPTNRLEELLERVRRYYHKERSTGRVSFTLAPGVEMGVKVFTSIRKTYKPSKARLYKVTNEEVNYQRKEYLEDGELLMPSDFNKYQEYGGKKIKFTLDEVKMISKVYDQGIELLGFKPLASFQPYLHIKPSNFIYPDEQAIKGSGNLFTCLLERCLARKVCPVVRVVARAGGSVAWGFLLPQEEVKDEKGCQETPPGFHICYLPFADDFRSIQLENRTRANAEQVDAAKDVIKKLNFKYHPECFENPDIQTHWRNIETLAMNRTYLEPVTDYTVPDYKRIDKKAGSLIEHFKSLVLPSSYDPEIVAKKRPPPKTAPAEKKMKPNVDMSVEEMANQKKVEKLNMDALKQWLTSKGVRVTGKKKAQLVQDVYDELGIDS